MIEQGIGGPKDKMSKQRDKMRKTKPSLRFYKLLLDLNDSPFQAA
jgi:hypothetical protein